VVRASIAAEAEAVPTVSIVCDGFDLQGKYTAAGLGYGALPFAVYPGHTNIESSQSLALNVRNVLIEQIIDGLTVQPDVSKIQDEEPDKTDIIFEGNFEGINDYFSIKEWSDGLPIVPPTIEKVEDFLNYTDRSPDEIIGIALPDRREATIWNIAVNGVLAGCRPEYMPILIAIVECMVDSKFGHEHLGHTPGTEVLITINGPIIKELGFNYTQGALRVGFKPNTSIGRFWRLYLRNVAGFLPHKADKATFGGTWRVVLAENEDVLNEIEWQPLSADQGYAKGDNVVTITSCTSTDSVFSIGYDKPERILDIIAKRVVDNQLYLFAIVNYMGPSPKPQIVLSPALARSLARGGYSKEKTRLYLYEHTKFPAHRFEDLRPNFMSLCEAVKEEKLPDCYCESEAPERLVPLVWTPEDLMISVSGDPDRDNCFLCAQNGFIGYPVSKCIDLPENWNTMIGGSTM
jgi:hypothetical protein